LGEWKDIGEKLMSNIDKYNEIFMKSFEIDGAMLGSELRYQSIPAWDSVGHMSMIAALEDVFNIMLETEDIIDFSSYDKGKEILSKYEVIF
jgi:acyl carrier protein